MRWMAGMWLLVCLVLMPFVATAQDPSSASPASGQQVLKPDELDALVAPIALYPDTLLAEVLMASTYPLEVVTADRWASANQNLKGDQLKTAVDKQSWDQSVKSLVATPSVLSMMSSKLDWTQKLGDAVLAQQPDIMDAIQRLRSKAHANNKLSSTKEQIVTVKQEENKQVIAIDPADPETVYVPYYDPGVVYGSWPYADYPPYYFEPPGYIPGGILATGIAFGTGYALARWAGAGNRWGGGVNWGNGNINVNRPINIDNARVSHWQHSPEHRHGVRYNNANVQQKFGSNANRAGSQERLDFRGRSGEQVLKPGGDRANLGDRGSEARPSAGDRDRGERPSAEARPSSGDKRASAGDRGSKASKGTRPSSEGKRASTGDRSSKASAGTRPSSDKKRASTGDRAPKASAGTRPSSGASRPARDSALNVQSGHVANLQSQRGHASVGAARGGGGAMRAGGGGGMRAGGGGRGGGGGRRSDMALKHDIVLLGRLDNGLGFYRFNYHGSDTAYVGVMAQEVQSVMPEVVVRGRDGYLRVFYDKLGLTFQTYDQWVASGARIPVTARTH